MGVSRVAGVHEISGCQPGGCVARGMVFAVVRMLMESRVFLNNQVPHK